MKIPTIKFSLPIFETLKETQELLILESTKHQKEKKQLQEAAELVGKLRGILLAVYKGSRQ